MKSKIILIMAAILLVAAGYFAITMTKEKLSQPEKEILVVGTNTPFPPFEFRNEEDVVGFDIDIAKAVAQELGRKLIIKDFTEFDALFPALQAGDLDMVASSVTIRVDRDEVVDFSQSYYSASQAILSQKGSTVSYRGNPEDFRSLKIAYQGGTTSESWVKDNLLDKVEVADYVVFDDLSYGLQLLTLGSVDVLILDQPVAESFAKSNPKLTVAGIIETKEQYGLVVQQGDPKGLLSDINRVITEMQKNGDYQELLEKWFGGDE